MSILDDIRCEKDIKTLLDKYGSDTVSCAFKNVIATKGDVWELFNQLSDNDKTEFEQEITEQTIQGMACDVQGQYIIDNMMSGVDYNIVEIVTAWLEQSDYRDESNIEELKQLLNNNK